MNRTMMHRAMMPCFEYAIYTDDPELAMLDAIELRNLFNDMGRFFKHHAGRVLRCLTWAFTHYTPRPTCADPALRRESVFPCSVRFAV